MIHSNFAWIWLLTLAALHLIHDAKFYPSVSAFSVSIAYVASPRSFHQSLHGRAFIRRQSNELRRKNSNASPKMKTSIYLSPEESELSAVSSALNANTDSAITAERLNAELNRILSNRTAISQGTTSPLRQAIDFLQQHHTTMRLSKANWDHIFDAIEDVTAQLATIDTGHNNAVVEFPILSSVRQDMTGLYQLLASASFSSAFPDTRETGNTTSTSMYQEPPLRLFGAVSTTEPPALFVGRNAIQQQISPQLFQDILSLPMSALTPSSSNAFLYFGALVAICEGLVSFFTGVNLNLLVGVTFLIIMLDRLLLNGATLETIFKVVSPELQQRIYHHEAGHFVLAYLLGCPIESIVVSAYAALQDPRFRNRPAFTAGTSFFDPILSEQMNADVVPKTAAALRESASKTVVGSASTEKGAGGVTRSSIDRYSMIVMAGIAAEADQYGQADGGASDEFALISFLSQLRSNRRNTDTWDSEHIRNQARWGALQAMLVLRQYRPAYDAVVKALEYGGTLKDCIYAIEQAGRSYDLPTKGNRQPVGYISQGDENGSTWTPNLYNNSFINKLLQKRI
jgi:hypothetical protein